MPQESPTKILTNFSAKAKFDDLPKEVVHETKRVLLDSVGVALASTLTDRGKIAIEYARRLGGRPEATILGVRDKSSCRGAAFANGEMISDLDYDARKEWRIGRFISHPLLFPRLWLWLSGKRPLERI
jgi:2-methylcitrate dehydratase PrpD